MVFLPELAFIFPVLANCHFLQVLNFSNNKLNSITKISFKSFLFSCIQLSVKITELDFSGNSLDSDFLMEICPVLEKIESLIRINFSGNNFDIYGLKILYQLICMKPNILALDIRKNPGISKKLSSHFCLQLEENFKRFEELTRINNGELKLNRNEREEKIKESLILGTNDFEDRLSIFAVKNKTENQAKIVKSKDENNSKNKNENNPKKINDANYKNKEDNIFPIFDNPVSEINYDISDLPQELHLLNSKQETEFYKTVPINSKFPNFISPSFPVSSFKSKSNKFPPTNDFNFSSSQKVSFRDTLASLHVLKPENLSFDKRISAGLKVLPSLRSSSKTTLPILPNRVDPKKSTDYLEKSRNNDIFSLANSRELLHSDRLTKTLQNDPMLIKTHSGLSDQTNFQPHISVSNCSNCNTLRTKIKFLETENLKLKKKLNNLSVLNQNALHSCFLTRFYYKPCHQRVGRIQP